MKSKRQLQIGETIKRAISDVFMQDDYLKVPGSYITILEADVSPDAKNARIFIDIYGNEKLHGHMMKSLTKLVPQIRHQIAKRVVLRVIPNLIFTLDKTAQKAIDLESLIDAESEKFSDE